MDAHTKKKQKKKERKKTNILGDYNNMLWLLTYVLRMMIVMHTCCSPCCNGLADVYFFATIPLYYHRMYQFMYANDYQSREDIFVL